MNPPLLAVENLSKAYGGVQAVDRVSFELSPGRLHAMIGPNGAGKSTCFNMLNGQVKPDVGAVRIDGRDVTGWRPRAIWRLGVGRTFQTAATFGSMSVRENVQVALLSIRRAWRRSFVWAGRAERGEAEALLALVGLQARADHACATLAYGDSKRLELAVALANGPALLLMDEPTAGMAPGERGELMRLVSSIAAERRIGVLFTEHDVEAVFSHADEVVVLDRGRVVASGPPYLIRQDATVRRVYLGT